MANEDSDKFPIKRAVGGPKQFVATFRLTDDILQLLEGGEENDLSISFDNKNKDGSLVIGDQTFTFSQQPLTKHYCLAQDRNGIEEIGPVTKKLVVKQSLDAKGKAEIRNRTNEAEQQRKAKKAKVLEQPKLNIGTGTKTTSTISSLSSLSSNRSKRVVPAKTITPAPTPAASTTASSAYGSHSNGTSSYSSTKPTTTASITSASTAKPTKRPSPPSAPLPSFSRAPPAEDPIPPSSFKPSSYYEPQPTYTNDEISPSVPMQKVKIKFIGGQVTGGPTGLLPASEPSHPPSDSSKRPRPPSSSTVSQTTHGGHPPQPQRQSAALLYDTSENTLLSIRAEILDQPQYDKYYAEYRSKYTKYQPLVEELNKNNRQVKELGERYKRETDEQKKKAHAQAIREYYQKNYKAYQAKELEYRKLHQELKAIKLRLRQYTDKKKQDEEEEEGALMS